MRLMHQLRSTPSTDPVGPPKEPVANGSVADLALAVEVSDEGTQKDASRPFVRRLGFSRQHVMATAGTDAVLVADLEAQLAEVKNQPPDLSKLSAADLAVLASEAAAGILRIARSESESMRTESEKVLNEAKAEAEGLIRSTKDETRALTDAAKADSQTTRDDAVAEAARTVGQANDEAGTTRAAAEKALEDAKAEAQATTDEATRDAGVRLEAAETEARTILEQANAEDQKIRLSADARARQVRAEAEAFGTKTRKDAEVEASGVVARANSEANSTIAGAKAEAAQIVNGALERREALFEDLEIQRRLLQSTLEDAAAVQASFVEGYGQLRKTLDESLSHLIEPAQRANRQLGNLDRELAGRDKS